MKGFQTKLDVIGNNIANVNTVGYKKSTINFQDLLSQNMSSSGANPMQVGLGSTTGAINVIHTPGSAMTTGVGSDLTLMGDGFFVVQEPSGDPAGGGTQYLTRAGNFVVDENGWLVNTQGYNVVNSNGEAIRIDANIYDSFSINREGVLMGKQSVDGAEVPIYGAGVTIGISSPPNPTGLSKIGGSLYEMTDAAGGALVVGTVADASTSVASGMLEMSNVDLTEEFTELIIAQRGFQANSRIISTSDEILQEVVNLKR